MPRTVPKSTRERSVSGSVSKKETFSRSASTMRFTRTEIDGLAAFGGLSGDATGTTTGQASTHSPQPVQSST